MSCKRILKVMSEYLDGDLAGHELLEFELHVDKCPMCAAELSAMSKMLACLGRLKVSSAPINCWHGVSKGIAEQRRGHGHWYSFLRRPLVIAPGLAAAIVALLFVFPIAPNAKFANVSPVSDPEYSSYISAHSNAQRAQSLSDPDVAFVAAELEKASLNTMSVVKP